MVAKQEHIQGPNRELSTVEELQRYETIMDSCLDITRNDKTGEFEIRVLGNLKKSSKNRKFISDVVNSVYNTLDRESIYDERLIAKSKFLEWAMKYHDNNNDYTNIPLGYITSYICLQDVLEEQERKK